MFLSDEIVLKQKTLSTRKVKWIVQKPIVYKDDQRNLNITVPVGFETDLASVPQCLWVLTPPFGKYTAPSIIHDYMYNKKFTDRSTADKVFYESMKDQKTNTFVRHVFYYMVKIFGNRAWKKNSKKLP